VRYRFKVMVQGTSRTTYPARVLWRMYR